MRLKPIRSIRGRVTLPGDKSISHRAAIIAALAPGTSRLTNFATSQDCASTLSCLLQLGVSIVQEGATVTIHGSGSDSFQVPDTELDCGNSGSTIRMLAGVLAGTPLTTTLTGDVSLRSRPMLRIAEPLELMGAEIVATNGKPPLTINGRDVLKPIKYRLPVASAQVKSCILFAGMQANGVTEVEESPGATRDHTERMLNYFGVPIETTKDEDGFARISVKGIAKPIARDFEIPGDISSAAFLIAAAALLPDSDLYISGVGLNPTRTQFLSVFQNAGLNIRIDELGERCNEPIGNIHVGGAKLRDEREGATLTNVLDHNLVAQLIDELPLLAVVATQIPGGLKIRGAKELRLKESDRISTTVQNLRSMGVSIDESPDGLSVAGPQRLRGAQLNSFGDHRIAMAFTVAALVAEGESELIGADSVAVSFPEFFEMLEGISAE